MVNPVLRNMLLIVSTTLWLTFPCLTWAITPDEIRAIDEEAAQQKKAKDARVKPGEVDQLLPADTSVEKPADKPDTTPTRSAKYSAASSETATPQKPMVRAIKPPQEEVSTANVPNTSQGAVVRAVAPADAIRTDGVTADSKKYFGIPLGTWFQVSLNRNVSNAETGQLELTVIEDVPGTRRTLPSGTLLFAEKTYNQGTKRLDCRAVRGITPKGYEFRITALCYDLQKAAGLNGIVNVDEQAVANKGMQRGVLSALRAASTSVAGANQIAAQGIQGAAASVLNDTGQAAEQAAGPTYTIFVAPQKMLIRVDESL